MYVKNHMLPKANLVTLQINESLESALNKINEGNFLSLPVFDEEIFKGILMKESIFRRYFEEGHSDKDKYLKEVQVQELLQTEVKTISEGDYIESASYLLSELRTPFLAVLNHNNQFVGILTHYAIFNAFSQILGVKEGTRIVINVYDTPGQIAKLTGVIKKANVNIDNFVVMDAKVMDIYRIILRVDTHNVDELVERIEKAGFKIAEISSI